MTATQAPEQRTFLTREELWEAYVADGEARGLTRFKKDRFNSSCKVYDLWRARDAQGSDGRITRPQIAEALGVPIQNLRSVDRWMGWMVRQGVIGKQHVTTAAGKTLGLRVELRAVSEVEALTRGCSSAGSNVIAPRIRIPRRQLTAQELCEGRVRPRRLRAGRGSPEPLGRPVPLFSTEESVAPIGPGGSSPTGTPPGPKEAQAACARGAPAGKSADAIEPSGDASPEAALERRLKAALGGEALRTLGRAERAFEAVLGPPAAGRLCRLPVIRELLWCLARLDRYGDFGRGRAGAGLSVLEARLDGALHDLRYDGSPAPAHLGYFIPPLRAEARRWKHRWAPAVKAEREARGVRRAPTVRSQIQRGEVPETVVYAARELGS